MARKKKSNDRIVENVNDEIIKKIQTLGFDPEHNIAGKALTDKEYDSEDDLFKTYAMTITELFKMRNKVDINPITHVTDLVIGFIFHGDCETGSFFYLLDEGEGKPHFTISDFGEVQTEMLRSLIMEEKKLKSESRDTIYYFMAVMTNDGKYKILSKDITDRILEENEMASEQNTDDF